MPQINLLSPGSQKKERQQAQPASAAGSSTEFSQVLPAVIFRCSICLAVIVVIWIFLGVTIAGKEKDAKKLRVRVSALKTNPKEIEKIQNERAILEKKARLIDQLSSRQFFWFQKVQLLADLIPDGVWLTRVYSREEKRAQPARRSSRQQEADDQAGQATVLVVQGTAVAYKIQDAVALVGTFIKNLQGSEAFAGDFKEIKLNNIAKTSIGEMDVMKFDLLCEQK